MAELTLKLTIDPVTGKKTVVVDYHSDSDALPNEHEEEHRRLVGELVEGAPLEAGAGLLVDRDSGEAPDVPETELEGERKTVEQKG